MRNQLIQRLNRLLGSVFLYEAHCHHNGHGHGNAHGVFQIAEYEGHASRAQQQQDERLFELLEEAEPERFGLLVGEFVGAMDVNARRSVRGGEAVCQRRRELVGCVLGREEGMGRCY